MHDGIGIISPMRAHKTAALEAFFREVAQLTLNHEETTENWAWVSPAKLGAALVKVDPEWWTCKPVDDDEGMEA